jgi:hypothetical protein
MSERVAITISARSELFSARKEQLPHQIRDGCDRAETYLKSCPDFHK